MKWFFHFDTRFIKLKFGAQKILLQSTPQNVAKLVAWRFSQPKIPNRLAAKVRFSTALALRRRPSRSALPRSRTWARSPIWPHISGTNRATEKFHIPIEPYWKHLSNGVLSISLAPVVLKKLSKNRAPRPWSGERRARGPPSADGERTIKTWLWRLNGWVFLAEKIVTRPVCPHFGGYFEVKFSVRRTFIKWNGCQILKITS